MEQENSPTLFDFISLLQINNKVEFILKIGTPTILFFGLFRINIINFH